MRSCPELAPPAPIGTSFRDLTGPAARTEGALILSQSQGPDIWVLRLIKDFPNVGRDFLSFLWNPRQFAGTWLSGHARLSGCRCAPIHLLGDTAYRVHPVISRGANSRELSCAVERLTTFGSARSVDVLCVNWRARGQNTQLGVSPLTGSRRGST